MAERGASDLDRFVSAQAPVFETALAELQAGRKRSHWMWFVFPQLRGLGQSETARFYGIASLDGGARLSRASAARAAARTLHARRAGGEGAIAARDLRLAGRSQVPLVHDAVRPRRVKGRTTSSVEALERWCAGAPDARTLALLDQGWPLPPAEP